MNARLRALAFLSVIVLPLVIPVAGSARTVRQTLVPSGADGDAAGKAALKVKSRKGILGGQLTVQAKKLDAGETPQPIHADDQMIPLAKPHVATVCNTMWALTDFTEANGATRIIPGSHLRDHSPIYGRHYDSIAAEMRRGSVLVWHGSLWHGGGANRTHTRRVGIAMNYCAGWIRQQENQ